MSDDATPPESLLPYEDWMEQALRRVVQTALDHAARHGLPGAHHFYITFRTDHPGVVIPPRLRAQYPQEMTIVLQHQYDHLVVDDEAAMFSVRLSFGGIPATLAVPFAAVVGFADPAVRFALQFRAAGAEGEDLDGGDAPADETEEAAAPPPPPPPSSEPQVVSLDAFRRRPVKE
ncbi:SspB family protein [Acidisphaera rubrifaciens]|uniref:Stringent starvation protein B n=1 Tax=Acidisphaera rubrifaciens HS-AP3 TaxID=1231350 RepID=A0A0D6P605_9PROT|nr:ClpXP protease specificity-enhancing factor SspB [Acidisphaera rubrifaciens]GAN76771.1 hypothetical protein Asru_0162_03 [Acidisphaera rubrifaciens HS-AP3]